MSEGMVFDIQRFAVHDGPGIRTTVFMKGCSCRCTWCHNPESQSACVQIEFYPSRCIGCMSCLQICPQGAHYVGEQGEHALERRRCSGCGMCVESCNANALVLKGKKMSVAEVMQPILADKAYYSESGGGMSLSGGEPVLQSEFALALLAACKENGIHTVLQTAGNYPYDLLEPLLPHLDVVMYDIKGFAPAVYSDYIHGDRELIFNNLLQLDEAFPGEIIVRTPCIGSVNDREDEISAIAAMLRQLKRLTYYQLLPYHRLAKAKYDALDLAFAENYITPTAKQIAALESVARRYVPVFNGKEHLDVIL